MASDVMYMPASEEAETIFWPRKVITIDAGAFYSNLYDGYAITPELEDYLNDIRIPHPNDRHRDLTQYARLAERNGALKGDWGPNVIDRVMIPYFTNQDGIVLDVRGVTTWKLATLARPEHNKISKQLIESRDKGDYYSLVDHTVGVYAIVLTSDDRLVYGVKGKGKQFGGPGEHTLVAGMGDRGTMSNMALHEIKDELGLTEDDFHFLNHEKRPVGWKEYAGGSDDKESKKWKMLMANNIPPFMVFDKPMSNNPMAVFIARTELSWMKLELELKKRRDKSNPDGAVDAWEHEYLSSIEATPENIREAVKENWPKSQAKVLGIFADYIEGKKLS